ncbi:MAG: WecB/TagA/CpsF family glycosyltransferase [Bradyrhizobium sp.]|nr:WecB/TagA/CpsF family glycosyltransferase [Bradyrhizobium sp.]
MLTRVPSLALVLLILPRIFAGLGPERYAAMFAALALGGLVTFLTAGAGVLGVRFIGAAASEGDQAQEATMFASLAAVNLAITATLMILAFSIELAAGQGLAVACVVLLPLVQAGLNATFDNARMAYNEHYRTALQVFGFHVLWYGLFITVPAFSGNILLAATVFHAPITLSSIVNAVSLVRVRPYLLRGKASRFTEVMRAGFSFGTADGLLMAAPGLMVIWLNAFAQPEITDWFATQSRLFQMLLSPLLMVLLPLAAFIRIKWSKASAKRQRDAITASLAFGVSGCIAMAVGLAIVGPFYAHHLLGLRPPTDWLTLALIFAFFGVVTLYRVFSSIAYLVLDSVDLAQRVIAASLIGGLAWVVAMPYRSPLTSFGIGASITSALVVAAVLLAAFRALRCARAVVATTDGEATTAILDIPIAITTHFKAARRILENIRARKSCYICERDVHGLMLAQHDPELCEIHREADMVLPDGMPLVHIARWRGHRAMRRVAGPDFVETMADLGRDERVRHYFHGGKPGVAARMAATLQQRFPGMAVAGTSSPPYRPMSDVEQQEQVATIMASAPDIVWVGLGTPKQERWMHRYYRTMPGVTLIGVGAAFDFHAGVVKRAPLWMQRATLEWLHRLLSEPRRLWRRYLLLAPAFLWRVLRDRST